MTTVLYVHHIIFSQVSRKVSKCGFLFVAPDFDFSNPLEKTKVCLKLLIYHLPGEIFAENKLNSEGSSSE
jgi:hypothetical protein